MIVYAQGLENPVLDKSIRKMEGVAFFNEAIPKFISWLLLIATVAFVIFFLVGGIRWITSQGDKNQIETARKQITYAFFGLLISFSVFLIVKLIGSVFGLTGLENLNISLPTLGN